MGIKPIMIVDVDNTLARSSKAIHQMYWARRVSSNWDGYVTYTDNHGWDFKGLLPDGCLEECLTFFDKEEFFNILEPMPGSQEVLKRLSNWFEIVVVSKHNVETVDLKAKWLKKHYPFIKRHVFLNQDGMDKSMIAGKWCIDDNLECIRSMENVTFRVVFGNYDYNKDSNFMRVNNWEEFGNLVEFIRF